MKRVRLPVTKKRVVIVDDSRTMQAVLEQIFSLRLGMDVVGMASDAMSAAALIHSLRPDLVTIDLCLPYVDGGKLLEMIADVPNLRKVIISGTTTDRLVMNARLEEMGADAFVSKSDMSRDPAAFCGSILAILAKPMARRRVPANDAGSFPKPALVRAAPGRPSGYPVPLDEQARLAALAKLRLANDDTDHQLDLLTRHLGETTDFAACVLTFIDRQRQWIKSAYGFAQGSTPRAQAFCNYTLCCDDLFIVSNAATDPRFADNPLVTAGPCIRTYVGCPVVSNDGVRLGALCLIDAKPRSVSPDVITNLRSVSRIAAEMINMRARETPLAA